MKLVVYCFLMVLCTCCGTSQYAIMHKMKVPPQPKLKPLPFKLSIDEQWISIVQEDKKDNQRGYFFITNGDTIYFNISNRIINQDSIQQTPQMSYYEDLILQEHEAKVFKINNTWHAYYFHNNSLVNAITVPNVKDEVKIVQVLREYQFIEDKNKPSKTKVSKTPKEQKAKNTEIQALNDRIDALQNQIRALEVLMIELKNN